MSSKHLEFILLQGEAFLAPRYQSIILTLKPPPKVYIAHVKESHFTENPIPSQALKLIEAEILQIYPSGSASFLSFCPRAAQICLDTLSVEAESGW